jgi:hypothetical protein
MPCFTGPISTGHTASILAAPRFALRYITTPRNAPPAEPHPSLPVWASPRLTCRTYLRRAADRFTIQVAPCHSCHTWPLCILPSPACRSLPLITSPGSSPPHLPGLSSLYPPSHATPAAPGLSLPILCLLFRTPLYLTCLSGIHRVSPRQTVPAVPCLSKPLSIAPFLACHSMPVLTFPYQRLPHLACRS